MAPRAPRLPVLLLLLAARAFPAAAQDTATPASPPSECMNSADCALRLGVGNVCQESRCTRYLDGRDLLEMIGLKKSRGVLEPYKLYPSIIPAFGYTPQNGFVLGITTLAGIYLGDPETTTISSLGLVAFFTTK